MPNEMMEAVAMMQAVAAVIETRETAVYLAAAGAEASAEGLRAHLRKVGKPDNPAGALLDDAFRKVVARINLEREADEAVAMSDDKPRRVQLRRTKGWRKPRNTLKVDRTTPWGNPFEEGPDMSRAECVAQFECLLAGECKNETERAWLARAVANRGYLKGKNLACWCALPRDGEPDICHAAALLRFANDDEGAP